MLKIAIPTNRPQAVVNYMNALAGLGAGGVTGREFSPEDFDGLLLPGGWDVNPVRYGKNRIPQETVDDELDAIQFDTLDRFVKAGKPVLGICRGHQLINIFFGGTLVQDLSCRGNHTSLPSGADRVHRVSVEPHSFLDAVYGPECSVNSSHHQGIETPGQGLAAVMFSEDGVTEAIEHKCLPVWGVQWHPERMCFAHRREDTADGSLVFRFFLEQCGNRT